MKWFRDRRTATKLMLSFGVLALIVGGMGLMGIRGMTGIQEQLRELYQYHALAAMNLEQSNGDMLATSNAVRGLLLASDPGQIEQRREQALSERQEFYTDFEQYRKALREDSEKDKASDAMTIFKELYSEQDQMLELARGGQHQQALARLPGLIAVSAKADQRMTEFSKYQEDRMKQNVDEAEREFEAAKVETLSIVAAAVLLALGLGILIARLISRPLAQAVSVLGVVGGGDLTATLEVNTHDEIGEMAKALNQAVTGMRQALLEVSDASANVSDAAQQLAAASEEVSSGAQEQASSLEETASSLEEMTSTVKQNAENARQASQLASGSRQSAEKGGEVVRAAVSAMGEINESSKRIADIISTIDEIAFQTNLLALNAAVEAARAGEQGRGFAVVATEVRNLAQRSATAAKEIKGLIQDSVRKVENGSELVNRSGQTLEEIVQSVKRVTDIVAEIAAASQEQATGIEQVNKATLQMDQVTQSNSAQTEEMSSTAQGLSSSAEQLQAMVKRFRLGAESKTPSRSSTPAKKAARRPPAGPHDPAPHKQLAALAKHTAASEEEQFEEF